MHAYELLFRTHPHLQMRYMISPAACIRYDDGDLDKAKFLTRFGFVPGSSTGEFIEAIGGKAKLPFGLRPY